MSITDKIKQLPDGEKFDLMRAAADKWLENEMWNQRNRRDVDLHDVAAFVRGFNAGYDIAQAARAISRKDSFNELGVLEKK